MPRRLTTWLALVAALVTAAAVAAAPAHAQEPQFWLTVLHNNDAESKLLGAGEGDLANYGGAARFKTVVDRLRLEARRGVDPTVCTSYNSRVIAAVQRYFDDPIARIGGCRDQSVPAGTRGVVMLSSGDNFLAGPQFQASLDRGVPYYDALAMNLIGYDAAAIGNHEFDFGPDVLADFIRGTTFPFVSANLDFANEPALQALFVDGHIVKSTVVETGGERIGVVGATTPLLPTISSPRRVAVSPDVAGAIQGQIDALEAGGLNKIIVISHLQAIAEDLALAPTLRGVDVMIAGGGDELLANPDDLLVPGDTPFGTYPLHATGADGADIPVVTTAGDYKYVGRLLIGFDEAGKVVTIDAGSGPVRVSGVGPDAVGPDPLIQSFVVNPVAASVSALASATIGVSEVALEGRRSPGVRTMETNLGDLLADSLLWTGRRLAPAFGVPEPDIALQNGGGIRNNSLIPAGPITELTTFSVAPFANFVSVVPAVTAEQLKAVLENAVSRVEVSDGRFAQIAGFSFTYDASAAAGSRVRDVTLADGAQLVAGGTVVAGAPTVDVATIDFLARGGDSYPLAGLPFTTLGATYQQALSDYIASPTGLNGVVTATAYPEAGTGRITRLN